MNERVDIGSASLILGDCLDVLRSMDADSVDSVVTDPPYHLTSIVKRFGSDSAASAKSNGATGVYARASAGFMGQKWDGGDVAFRPETWAEVLRVMKPGAHLLAFSGTRTYHRMVCAIEDAGAEIRDQVAWVYATGFPKSHNLPGGWGTALKPAWEPIVVARKPLIGTVAANVERFGTGALNIDATRIGVGEDKGGWPVTKRRHNDVAWTLQPVETDRSTGRWPANLCHDGSEEVLAGFPSTGPSSGHTRRNTPAGVNKAHSYGRSKEDWSTSGPSDSGSAARFFYCPKSSRADRGEGNTHPTVKPTDLMRWLCRLVTPPGGLVLDPFTGSGSTGKAAKGEGFRFLGIEREPEYFQIAERRIRAAHPDMPLFAEVAE